jgi:hypothetical protein
LLSDSSQTFLINSGIGIASSYRTCLRDLRLYNGVGLSSQEIAQVASGQHLSAYAAYLYFSFSFNSSSIAANYGSYLDSSGANRDATITTDALVWRGMNCSRDYSSPLLSQGLVLFSLFASLFFFLDLTLT